MEEVSKALFWLESALHLFHLCSRTEHQCPSAQMVGHALAKANSETLRGEG
jgi:hypothetical protein